MNTEPSAESPLEPAQPAAPAKPKRKFFALKSKFLWISIGFHALLLLVAGYFVVSTIVSRPKPEFKAGPKGPSAPASMEHQIQMTKRQNTMSAPATKRIVTKGANAAIALPDLPSLGQDDSFAPSAMAGMGAPGAAGQMGGGLGGGGEPINFFGLRAKSKSIVFIIDVTGSMVSGKKDSSTWVLLEDKVTESISKLPSNTNFNVVVFGPDSQSFKPNLVPATKTNIDAALSFVKSWSPVRALKGGETKGTAATWDTPRGKRHKGTVPSKAFQLAFRMKPETIMFLSDGDPTVPDKPAAVLTLLQQLQGQITKKVKISVIAYFADSGQAFMRAVAEQNGGEFREISVRSDAETGAKPAL